MEQDTLQLLGKCDAGIKMAVSAMDEVLPGIENDILRRQVTSNRQQHAALQEQTRRRLAELGEPEQNPNPMAQAMSWLKSEATMTFKPGDAAVADLLVGGCNMGIKNLHKYQNQYKNADKGSKELADKLIGLESELASQLYLYL